MKAKTVSAAALAVAALMSLAATATASDPAALASTSCELAYTGFLVDRKNVAAEVPAEYELARRYGPASAVLLVRTIKCDALSVDGETRPTKLSTVSVAVEKRDERDTGLTSYLLWAVTDNSQLRARLNAIGFDNAHRVENIGYESNNSPLDDGRLASAEVDVPYEVSPYTYWIENAAVTGVTTQLWTFYRDFYTNGTRHTARMSLTERYEPFRLGTGGIATPPNTPLARYLGASSAVAGIAEVAVVTNEEGEIARWR